MSRRGRLASGSAMAAVCCAISAVGADPLGLYVGGAVGQGKVTADVANPYDSVSPIPHSPVPAASTFTDEHVAFKALAGVRPIRTLGAELSYFDMGSPDGSLFGHPGSGSIKGASAFGLVYLPISAVDVFAKAGVARLQSEFSGQAPSPIFNIPIPAGLCGTCPFHGDRTSTNFAAGAGAQLERGSWTIRAEYERFNLEGESPYLLSLGLTWSL